MHIFKAPWLALVLASAVATLVSGTRAPDVAMPSLTSGAASYSTRELALESRNPQGMVLWEGKILYSDVTITRERTTSRILEHDLETGRETMMIEPRSPHHGARILSRSGDWLFYVEEGIDDPRVFFPPADYYALNLRTGQQQQLPMLKDTIGPNLSGGAFGDKGLAYTRADGEGRTQLRVYSLETGDDQLLLEIEHTNTLLWSPMLRDDKVIFEQRWQGEWPTGFTPTPIPGRPGSQPPRYQLTGDIFSLDLNTRERVNLSNTDSASQPALWGAYLMWIDSPGGSQEHGSGEVCVLNMRTGEMKQLTSDATYMHFYSAPLAGDGFFVWRDARQVKDKLPVYLPESDEMIYLQGPGDGSILDDARPDGKVLFWSWSDWSGLEARGPAGSVDYDQVKDRPRKDFMTMFD